MKCKKCHKEIENLKVCPYCKSKQIKEKAIKEATAGINIAEKEIEKVFFLNNSKIISYILIGILSAFLIVSSFTVETSFVGYLFRNFITIFLLVYFIAVQFSAGKKKFAYFNLGVCFLLFVQFLFTTFQLFVQFKVGLFFASISEFLLGIFFIKKFLEDYVEDITFFEALSDKGYFYAIILLGVLRLCFSINVLLQGYILSYCVYGLYFVYMCFMARYIYLYNVEKKGLFTDIKKMSEELSVKDIEKAKKQVLKKYNGYQILGILVVLFGSVMGIYIGSESGICTGADTSCTTSSFDFPAMFRILGIAFLIGVILFWMGHVLKYLQEIAKNTKKDVKNMKKNVKNID